MAAKPVALILGAGPRVGASVAQKFLSNGYKVAVASRSGAQLVDGALALKADFSKPDSIPALFEKVKSEFKAAPSVVVYNAATISAPPDSESALSLPVESILTDMNVNTVSAYAAAQEAVSGWATLPKDTKKTFIYTGNGRNSTIMPPMPMLMTLGMGKSASAHFVGIADSAYAGKGYRFFYADERDANGNIKGMALDGDAHGDFYWQLANHVDAPWLATFVKDKGYVKF